MGVGVDRIIGVYCWEVRQKQVILEGMHKMYKAFASYENTILWT